VPFNAEVRRLKSIKDSYPPFANGDNGRAMGCRRNDRLRRILTNHSATLKPLTPFVLIIPRRSEKLSRISVSGKAIRLESA
jgi:hypothetical protein